MSISTAPDTVRLRTALRDLVALSTIPAAWVGREPAAIAAGLVDLLVGSLDLDFAFVRLCDPNEAAAVEVTRGDAWRSFPEWLREHSSVIGQFSPRKVIPDVDGRAQPYRGIVIPVGVDGEGGLVAAASSRASFPEEIDALLLSVAANQAATAFQGARLLHERRQAEAALRQAHDELETRVAERTAELRRTTAELQQRESKIRRLVDANIIGIFIWEFNGRILEANDAFLGMIGYDRDDLAAGRIRWTDLSPVDRRDHDAQMMRQSPIAGGGGPFEKEFVHKDGRPVPILLGATTFEGDANQGVGFVLDLTDRKRAEHRVLAEHRATRILAEAATLEEAAPKIVQVVCECLEWDFGTWWRIDREANVLRCAELWRRPSVKAPEFEAVTRAYAFRSGAGLPGRVWATGAPACVPDVVKAPTFLRASVAARERLHAVFAFPILLGSEVLAVIELVSREIRQPDRDLLDMMATLGSQIGQFIERKRAESALQRARTELAHVTRVATMGEITASIAHELRQPIAASLTSAQTALRWLDSEPPDLAEVREAVSRTVRADKRAEDVIGRIRALATKAPPRMVSVEINAAIGEVIELMHGEAVRNGVSMRTELAQDLPLVQGDRVQLQQVLLNLIINGIEAMSSVGEGSRELHVSTTNDEARGVLVSVRDTGLGLATDAFEQVFAAFYTTKPAGLGLGLSICRTIIEAHGGRLWVSANELRGVTFQFTLPGRSSNQER